MSHASDVIVIFTGRCFPVQTESDELKATHKGKTAATAADGAARNGRTGASNYRLKGTLAKCCKHGGWAEGGRAHEWLSYMRASEANPQENITMLDLTRRAAHSSLETILLNAYYRGAVTVSA